jgi:hypothetical protein
VCETVAQAAGRIASQREELRQNGALVSRQATDCIKMEQVL